MVKVDKFNMNRTWVKLSKSHLTDLLFSMLNNPMLSSMILCSSCGRGHKLCI